MTPEESVPRLDDTDKAIIRSLQEDGRMSYATLGPKVGLSPAAARQRVLQLIESGVMQIVAVTDPIKLGFPIQAMVGLRVSGDLDLVASAISGFGEVSYVVYTTGRFELLVEIVSESMEHFLGLLNKMRVIPGVEGTETFTYLRLEKQAYNWGAV